MKIGVVGCGMVGATSAFALVMNGVGREIVLVDANRERAEAEANDIYHAVPFAHPLTVSAGDYSALAGARVVVIAAGVAQAPGETRLELLQRNAEVFRAVVPSVLRYAPEAALLIVTNPVDVMTHLASKFAAKFGVPRTRVFGSGTTLDTARLRALVGLRRAAYHIISGKGATYYGIGSAVSHIVDVLLHDRRAVLTICSRIEGVSDCDGVTLALPHVLGGSGVLATLPLPLDVDEAARLRRSAGVLRDALASLRID